MSRGRRPGRERHALSPEDEALWQTLTASVQPLEHNKTRVRKVSGSGTGASDADERLAFTRAQAGDGGPLAAERFAEPAAVPAKRATHAPPLADLDHRKVRRLAAGRERIDARIDLHGMRQAEAHAALRSFLLGCHASGRRNVLVITGKGGAAQRGAEPADGLFDLRERGVLKRSVPMWLAEPELRAIVVGFRTASLRHGGEGALYVQLRARRQTRP